MSQLKTLSLHFATPIASPDTPFVSTPQCTVMLPSLTKFLISACARDCALALAHLVLPALSHLTVAAESHEREGDDVRLLIHYVARHAVGPQDTERLRSVLISGKRAHAEMVVWAVPDADIPVCGLISMFEASISARVVFLTNNKKWRFGTDSLIFDDLLTHLPLNSISTLTTLNHTELNNDVWLRHEPSWPLLERVRLVPTAFGSFRKMLASYPRPNGPRLPSLSKLILESVTLTVQRTYHLCDMLIDRAEQGVPLEALDLSTCFGADWAVQLLEEIVADVQRPVVTMEVGTSNWNEGTRIKFFDEEGLTEDDDHVYDPGPWYEKLEDEDEDWDEEEEDKVDDYDDDDYYDESYLDPDIF